MNELQINPPLLSHWLQHKLQTYSQRKIGLGCSAARVFELHRPQERLFLKWQALPSPDSLQREAEILRWLQGRLPVPELKAAEQQAEEEILLMSAVPGLDASQPELCADPLVLAELLAAALKRCHSLDISGCPFVADLPAKIQQAEAHLTAGWVDLDDFDPEHLGRDPQAMLAELKARAAGSTERLVFTHGDACLPNLIFEKPSGEWQLSGLIDLGRAGLADPWQDLALACRSLRHNGYDEAVVSHFLANYGAVDNPEKYALYVLLDEFF